MNFEHLVNIIYTRNTSRDLYILEEEGFTVSEASCTCISFIAHFIFVSGFNVVIVTLFVLEKLQMYLFYQARVWFYYAIKLEYTLRELLAVFLWTASWDQSKALFTHHRYSLLASCIFVRYGITVAYLLPDYSAGIIGHKWDVSKKFHTSKKNDWHILCSFPIDILYIPEKYKLSSSRHLEKWRAKLGFWHYSSQMFILQKEHSNKRC